MDPDLQQQVQKRLAELPAGVQAAIHSAEVAAKIQEIGRKAKLHLDQMGRLEDEVYLVMLGFADPAEFADNLAEALGLAPAAAASLATDVTNEIFMTIRASMQEWAEEQAATQDAALVSEAIGAQQPPSRIPPLAAASATPAAKDAAPAPSPTKPSLGAADAILSEKKVTPPPAAAPAPAAPSVLATPAASPMPKVDPAAPQNYKADPYREPVE